MEDFVFNGQHGFLLGLGVLGPVDFDPVLLGGGWVSWALVFDDSRVPLGRIRE